MACVTPSVSPVELAALVLEYQRALVAERLADRLVHSGRLDNVQYWARNQRRHRALLALQRARVA